MAESNNSKKLHNSFYEIDEHHDRKRGKGSENKQPTLLVLSTSEDNEYPQYIKCHALPDYKGENHKLRWLNTFARNIQSNIYHVYRSVKKRDLPLFLAKQEWRNNHHYSGKIIMKKVMKS